MRGLELTSSAIVSRALALIPDGVRLQGDAVCAMCGAHIAHGSIVAPFAVGEGFMDDLSLAARGSPAICQHCETLTHMDALRASGHGAFNAFGVMPMRKWADVRAALLFPPEPPFVMVYATANNQHMGWRAPVNHSKDAYMVRVGLRDLLIRRKVLLRAVDACAVLARALGLEWPATAATSPHPFIGLSSDLKEPTHAVLRPALCDPSFRATLDEREREALRLIMGLTLGETWALRFVLTDKKD